MFISSIDSLSVKKRHGLTAVQNCQGTHPEAIKWTINPMPWNLFLINVHSNPHTCSKLVFCGGARVAPVGGPPPRGTLAWTRHGATYCNRGSGRPPWRPRSSDPATYHGGYASGPRPCGCRVGRLPPRSRNDVPCIVQAASTVGETGDRTRAGNQFLDRRGTALLRKDFHKRKMSPFFGLRAHCPNDSRLV